MAGRPKRRQRNPIDEAAMDTPPSNTNTGQIDLRNRKHPTEALADPRKRTDIPENLLDMSPVLQKDELIELQEEMINATPEQFQVMLGKVYRIMLVRGLKDIPAPKSIKEIQALNDMIRRSEGVEARERGGGAPAGGFLPRVVSRRKLGVTSTEPKIMEVEVVAPPPESADSPDAAQDTTAPESADSPDAAQDSGSPTQDSGGFF
jgi:hypothetical protein